MNTGFDNQDLTGTLPTGLGDLGPALKSLYLFANQISELPTELGALTGLAGLVLPNNAITSLPTEIGALTGLVALDLSFNWLTDVPTEFRTVNPSTFCYLFNQFPDPEFSQASICANIGADTSCCTDITNSGLGIWDSGLGNCLVEFCF